MADFPSWWSEQGGEPKLFNDAEFIPEGWVQRNVQHIRGDWVVMDDPKEVAKDAARAKNFKASVEAEEAAQMPEFIKQSAKKVQTKKHGTLKVNTKGAKHGRH